MSDNDQIETWLDGIGLAQYASAFAENAIDLEVLPDVTETDLEKLGVALGPSKTDSQSDRCAVRRDTSRRRAGHGARPAAIRA